MKAALRRFRASSRPSGADTAALRRWTDSLRAAGASLHSQEPAQARTVLKQALRAYRILSDSAGIAASIGEIGDTYDRQSRFEETMAQYERALALFRSLGTREKIALYLNKIGNIHKDQGRYETALAHYKEALRIRRDIGNREGIAQTLNNIGLVHWKRDHYEKALSRYDASLQMKRKLGDRTGVATTLNNIGLILWNQGRYEKALSRYRESLQIKRELGDRRGVATTLNNIGIILWKQGRYEKALDRYRASLRVKRDLGDREGVARTLNNIGLVYESQGQWDEALARYRSSLKIKREIGNQEGIARTLNNMGNLLRQRGQYEKALVQYRSSLQIKRELGNRKGIANTLENIGNVHRQRGRYGEALARYREALQIYREIGNRNGIANTLRNIGNTRRDQGRWEEALARYRASLRIERAIGDRKEATQTLSALGILQLRKGNLRAATDTLRRAVDRAKALRLNASSPEARRSLLSTQIGTYQALTMAHVRLGRPDSALRSVEQARARLLADRLAGTATGDTTFTIPPAPVLHRTLDRGEAALLYTNVDTRWPLTALLVTPDTTVARELPDASFRTKVRRAYAPRLKRLRRKKGPLTAALGPDRTDTDSRTPSLAEIIRLYRYYLIREEGGEAVQQDLARRLYNLLVAPVETAVPSREALTIIPTGSLGYLPFETLRAPTGRYLVQNAHVRYAQSLTILRQLEGRTYAASRQPLLAIGNPAYGGLSPKQTAPLLATARGTSMIETEAHAVSLYRSAEQRIERGRSPRPTYVQLGYDRWPTLYGTKLEVQKLKRAMGPGTTVLAGPAASEKRIRQMSEEGQLARYRRIHFATHGIAVPEAPTLSALVLSQVGTSDSLAARDGYLTMREIADLKMRADVAVLSACRTGLGRIIAGEGVVNLSHAFLRAGANATLVSQWRVLDWSTQQFMTAVYRRAKKADTSFAEAVTHVKRAFSTGEFGKHNTDPLRWAPFVYYGRE